MSGLLCLAGLGSAFMILALGAVVKIPTQLRSGADISPVCSGS